MLPALLSRSQPSDGKPNSLFREERTFDQRCDEANSIFRKYPTRVPIICERQKGCTQLPPLDKRKYLVPNDLTVAQFVFVIRKRMTLDAAHALFVTVNGTIPPSSASIGCLHKTHRDEDGFLYMQFMGENTFG
jgi:GABA(A) receptor-associated protein